MGSSVLEMLGAILVVIAISGAWTSPVPQDQDMSQAPMPYRFSHRVSESAAEPRGLFWSQEEEASEESPGRVDGSYSVWLPDGRLMTVSYYVSGDSGFVPTIEYIDDYSPSF